MLPHSFNPMGMARPSGPTVFDREEAVLPTLEELKSISTSNLLRLMRELSPYDVQRLIFRVSGRETGGEGATTIIRNRVASNLGTILRSNGSYEMNKYYLKIACPELVIAISSAGNISVVVNKYDPSYRLHNGNRRGNTNGREDFYG